MGDFKIKTCSACKQIKTFENFSKSKYHLSGYMSQCKICRAKHETIRRKNPEYKKQIKEYKTKPENKRRTKDLALKRLFNLTIIEYDDMLKKQNGVCAICSLIFKNKSLAVDHCHATGKIRGLLCSNCNQGLGYFKDDIELFNKAIKYIKENNK